MRGSCAARCATPENLLTHSPASLLIIVANSTIPIGREHWSIPFYLKLQHDPSLSAAAFEQQLRHAWQLMRFKHPSIAATLQEGNVLQYVVPGTNGSSVEAWMAESFFVVPGKTRQDVIASLPPELNMTLRYLPNSCELVFHSSHWRSDGIGVLHLMDDFLDLVVQAGQQSPPPQIAWGVETSRLAISNEEAYGMPTELTPAIRATAAKYGGTFDLIPSAVGVQYKPTSAVPGGVRDATVRFTAAETAEVVKRAKVLGVSVTSAVHAALALANWAFAAPTDQHKHYTSTIRLNMRPKLPAPYSSRAYAAAEATTGYMFAVQAGTAWLDLARAYHAAYRAGIPAGLLDAHRQYGQEILAFMARTAASGAPPPSDGDISSLGVVDEIVRPHRGDGAQALEVLDLGVGAEHATPQMDMFVWTFRGCLRFYNIYNENLHAAADVQAFTEYVKQVLLEQLRSG